MTLEYIINEFADLEPRERLELLLEYSEGLPPLPSEYEAQRLAGEHRVHECQTPVFLWVNVHQETTGVETPDSASKDSPPAQAQVEIHAWVAPEAPTVKGFVAILREAFHGQAVETVLAAPLDLLQRLGLAQALGMMRTRGLSAILHYIRRQVERGGSIDGSYT
ncbi:MAG: SufE family protein [Pirellulales bacterium]|nr:SufE family protein [Pirellulales bacterium]